MGGATMRAWGAMAASAVAYAAVIVGFDAATAALLRGATSSSNNELALSALMSGIGFAAFIGLLAVEVRTYRSIVRHAGEGIEGRDKVLLGFALWFFGNLPLSFVNVFVQMRASIPLADMKGLFAQIALSVSLLVAAALRFRGK